MGAGRYKTQADQVVESAYTYQVRIGERRSSEDEQSDEWSRAMGLGKHAELGQRFGLNNNRNEASENASRMLIV
jgi:hypothetical protein